MSEQPDDLTSFQTTPRLAATLGIAFESLLATKHTAIPGVVTAYDADRQEVDVQPAIRRRFKDGSTAAFPELVRVPVVFFQTAQFVIHAAPQAGDAVLLIFAERSIDEWLSGGGSDVTARDPRRFDLQDAIAIAGLSPNSAPIPEAARPDDALCLATRDGSSRLEIKDGGAITVTSSDVDLGGEGGTPVALADAVDGHLNDAWNAVSALASALGMPSPWPVKPTSTGATRVRAI